MSKSFKTKRAAIMMLVTTMAAPLSTVAATFEYHLVKPNLVVNSPAGSASTSGTGTPAVSTSASILTWDATTSPTLVGASTTQSVRLTNSGTTALTLTAVPAIIGNAAFTFPSSSTTCGSALDIGAYCDTTVKFTAASTVAVPGTLTFATSAGTKTVTLAGTGTQAAGNLTASSGSSADFGVVSAGSTATRNFVFTNTGTGAATGVYASVTPAQGLALATNNCGVSGTPVTIAGGGNCTFSVVFTPTTGVALTGTQATVTSSAANSPTSLALSGTAVVPDPYAANVTFLYHMEGANGSTTFNNAIGGSTTGVTATVSTVRSKFGTGSAYMNGGNIPLGTQNFTGAFTLEWFYYPTSYTGANGLSANNSGSLFTAYNGGFSVARQGAWLINTGVYPTLNAWHHLVVQRDGSNLLSVYLNGTRIGMTTSSDVFGSDSSYRIEGGAGSYIDEFRVTKGVARYSGATLTVPTTPLMP